MKSKKRIIPILFLSLILIFSLLPIPHVRAGWLPGWAFRVKLTVDQNDITSALSDFPVLIYISSSSGINNEDVTFVFDEIGANYLKLAVTESDGTTECYVEIEKWDLGNEKAWLWGKSPSISSVADTEIYLYYDNAHADNTAHVGIKESASGENVWDSNFLMVQHMDEASGNIKDSTSKDRDGTQGQTPTYGQTGEIDDAIEFDGVRDTGDYFQLADHADLSFDAFTWEAWVYLNDKTADNTNSMMVGAKSGGGGSREWQFDMTRSNPNDPWKVKPNLGNSAGNWGMTGLTSTGTIPWNSWRYVTVTWDGTTVKIYIEGSFDSQIGYSNTIKDTGSIPYLARADTAHQYMDGIMDEIRFSSTARNSAWIKATYETERDHLIDWGIEEEPPNLIPTITSASIPDRDDGDNCYEMESYYNLIAVVNDGDGAVHISDVYIQGKQGGAVRFEVRGTSLDGAPSYSIQTGATIIDIDAGSCSWVENGDEGTLTIKIRFEWDFTDEINLEIAVYVEDASGGSAGFTVMQTDYFDVLGRLVTSNLAVTDGRIDRNTATTFSGDVKYATTIGGNTPSVKYPPDAQWTAVHIHDSAHVSKGNDAVIVNGAFSGISVTVPDAVQSNTYHVFYDLVPDYSDGDAPDGDTIAVIGDQMEIVSVAFPDSRININTASEVRYVLRYDHDDVAFEGADGSIIGYDWDVGNSWWDKVVTSPANPGHDVYDENDLGALTDNTHGLTVYEDDAGSNLVGDRIKVLTLTANVTARLINEDIQLILTAELEYDNHPLGAGDSVEINGAVFVWDAGDSRFEVDVTESIAQIVLYDTITDGTEATYGITVGNIDGNSVTIVFYEGVFRLFGAGFNASSPYVELYWKHSLALMDFFEVQNSSDRLSWTYLGQNTTTQYTDLQVINGTERYYRIRTCLFSGGQWYNGSFSYVDFEKVYFIATEAGPAGPLVESDFPWIAIAIALSIIVLLLSWLKHGD